MATATHAPSQKVSQQDEQICQASPIIYRLGLFRNVLAVVKDGDQGVEPNLVSRSSVMGVEGVKKLLQLFSVVRKGVTWELSGLPEALGSSAKLLQLVEVHLLCLPCTCTRTPTHRAEPLFPVWLLFPLLPQRTGPCPSLVGCLFSGVVFPFFSARPPFGEILVVDRQLHVHYVQITWTRRAEIAALAGPLVDMVCCCMATKVWSRIWAVVSLNTYLFSFFLLALFSHPIPHTQMPSICRRSHKRARPRFFDMSLDGAQLEHNDARRWIPREMGPHDDTRSAAERLHLPCFFLGSLFSLFELVTFLTGPIRELPWGP